MLVTGATSGIGLLTVLELGRAGYQVVGTARSGEKAEGLLARARREGVEVRVVLCDATDPLSCEAAVAETAKLTDGGPWALVNNAGGPLPGPVEEIGDEAVRRHLELNLIAPVRLARMVIPAMRACGSGRIVNISSGSGRVNFPFVGWYSAGKHALESISDTLRMELRGFGIEVCLVEPGRFASSIWGRAQEEFSPGPATVYPAAAGLIRRYTEQGIRLRQPFPVARAVRRCLEARRPWARYPVGWDAWVGIYAEEHLPRVLTDYLKCMAIGACPVPPGSRGVLRFVTGGEKK
ncbi:SDR family oxidoreductase [Streptomyces albireticuli]|uniref:SDR family oxidoreductase n=1 Tax=Streptomyces albireticuli TaxID=1940 RepID=UPI001475FB2A|nr:SDR family oxidoreductase [Streptomyces albireticuli]MCD9145726.1 SDR family oxidoreductase [Streptomyces albireticuli]MCD9165542.1 SDR family oxidoreductase [Streptomyces albireticuli]